MRALWIRLTRIAREVRLWIRATGLFWVAVLYPVCVLLWTGVFVQSTGAQVETAGQILQVAALMAIAIGLNAVRRELRSDKQGFGSELVSSLERLKEILFPPERRDAEMDLEVGEKGVDRADCSAYTTPEGRIATLEREVKAGHARMVALEGQYDSLVRDLSQWNAAIEKSINERHTKPYLQRLPIELVSVLWLTLGSIMVWFPGHIANIVGAG